LQEIKTMPKSARTHSYHRTFAALAAAARVANAVETRRFPRGEDLKTLGIDPEAFRRVQL
jgi:hypothetical protein